MTPVLNNAPLDCLLRQSLSALMRKEDRATQALTHLSAILSRIARFFRAANTVSVQCVIEPDAVSIEIDGQRLRCPRLLVQCTSRGMAFAPVLTFIYTPASHDRIVLSVAHGNRVHQEASPILWNASHGWHIPSHGTALDDEAHAALVRNALFNARLFSGSTLALEPVSM